MSALETIQLILSFGIFTMTLIRLVVDLLKNDKKITVNFELNPKCWTLRKLEYNEAYIQ